MRFTGRPRLIPDDDSTRCMTRSTAGTSWNRRRTQAQPGLAGSGRTPPVKGVGEPCAGEPHARFDGRGLETERISVTAPAPDPTILAAGGSFRAPRSGQLSVSVERADRVAATPRPSVGH